MQPQRICKWDCMGKKIYVASDHAGFGLKKHVVAYLKKIGFDAIDLGPHTYDKDDDYPDYAIVVSKKVARGEGRGVLICGSGQGMDRAANKVPGVYASVCWDEESAVVASMHGDVNVLCLGARFVGIAGARKILRIWATREGEVEARHKRRISKIIKIEQESIASSSRRK